MTGFGLGIERGLRDKTPLATGVFRNTASKFLSCEMERESSYSNTTAGQSLLVSIKLKCHMFNRDLLMKAEDW